MQMFPCRHVQRDVGCDLIYLRAKNSALSHAVERRHEMTRQVTVHLQQDTARKFHRGEHDTPETREIVKEIKKAGGDLAPMHPGAQDEELAKYFTVEVPDDETAEKVIDRLQNCRAVEAAYLKPPASLP
jgi:hypothetical protein